MFFLVFDRFSPSRLPEVSLDSLEIETPQLALKIDVEGSEEEVLLGATEVLKTRPTRLGKSATARVYVN